MKARDRTPIAITMGPCQIFPEGADLNGIISPQVTLHVPLFFYSLCPRHHHSFLTKLTFVTPAAMFEVLPMATHLLHLPQQHADLLPTQPPQPAPSPRTRIFQALPGDTLEVHVDRLCIAGYSNSEQLLAFMNACDRTHVRLLSPSATSRTFLPFIQTLSALYASL